MDSGVVTTDGIDLHFVERGTGPAVVLCHGFPETSRSWRHQMTALADAGFRAIAPDMRGYGGSSAPDDPAAYAQPVIAADLVGLLDGLGIETATVIGHDWGAVAAWNAALLHPARFTRVVGLTIPYIPRGEVDLLHQLKQDHAHFYMDLYRRSITNEFLMHDVEGSLLLGYWTASGEAPASQRFDPFASPLASVLPTHTELPSFLTKEDLAAAVQSFSATSFEGGLNWYRGIEATFDQMAAYKDAPIPQPSLFIVGDEDAIVDVTGEWIEALPRNAPGLTRTVRLPGVGHWVQQEAPEAVNEAILAFLRS